MKPSSAERMQFLVLTLFPEMFEGPFSESIVKRAIEQKKIKVEMKNIRDFGIGKRKTVDDLPYGGGAGMVMRPDVLGEALRWAKEKYPDGKIINFSPHGERLTQKKSKELATEMTPLILLCGHYEGIDERVREVFIDEEISLGDFVLTGGEIPAMALIDSVARLIPGVLGNNESPEEESFSLEFGGRGEYPQYTRPEIYEGKKVPDVLLSGNHSEIRKWRRSHLAGFTEREQEIFSLRNSRFSPEKPWKCSGLFMRKHISSDVDCWMEWFNDPKVTEMITLDPPVTRDDEEDYFDYTERSFHGLFLTICEKKKKIPIGSMSIELSESNDNAGKFGIVIGEKGFWGKGYGTEATREMQRIAFELLHLEKISLRVFEENLSARAVYEKCGFVPVGTLRGEVRKKDGLHTILIYDCRNPEWRAKAFEDSEDRTFMNFRNRFDLGV